MKIHDNLNKLIALTGALVLCGLFIGRADEPKKADQDKIQLMFVQTADDFKADGKTLRLINVGQQTLYFSDRPVRIAGHLTMPAYMDEWKAGEGPDNFSSDPPNATLSVYEPGRNDNTLAVVEISHPLMDGKDLVYQYKLIEGRDAESRRCNRLIRRLDRCGRWCWSRFPWRGSRCSRGWLETVVSILSSNRVHSLVALIMSIRPLGMALKSHTQRVATLLILCTELTTTQINIPPIS